MAEVAIQNKKPFITVFTPTYNRAYSLGDVYDCLCEQSLQDFEWVIVDDGSTDDTEQLVKLWLNEDRIAIQYVKKNNGGKHTAINRGLTLARGEWFLIFDSDDKCTSNTIERFKQIYLELKPEDIVEISTISVRSVTELGENVGPVYGFNKKIVESPIKQLAFRSQAERWGINKTTLMQNLPFPEFEGERFVPESLIWNRLSLKYSTLFVDEALRIFTPRKDGLTASMLKIRVNSPIGTALVYKEMMLLRPDFWMALKAKVNYFRFQSHAKKLVFSEFLNPLCWLGIGVKLTDVLRLRFGG